jgi:preprotein translocase subunit SecG
MEFLIPSLTVIECLVCLLLVLIVLMQRPRQEGLGASFGEGVANQVWGAQTTNALQKITGWLAVALFALTISLASLISAKNHQAAPAYEKKVEVPAAAPAAPAAPTAPAVSVTPTATATPAVTVTPTPAPAAAPKADAPKTAEAPKVEAPKVEAPKAPAVAPATPAPAAPAPAGNGK